MNTEKQSADQGKSKGNSVEGAAPIPPPDIFANLDALRLDPSVSLAGAVEVLLHVPVRKPGKVEFVRTHPDQSMALATAIFRDDDERADYFVAPAIRPFLAGYLKPVQLTVAISRQGVVFLWPVPLPDPDGRTNAWSDSQRQGAALAREQWVRLKTDMDLGSYRVILAEGELPAPTWPDKPLAELLRIAFRGHTVDTAEHPIIRKLRGIS